MLLDFCLSDIDTASPESLRQLAGLQLIPTLGGTLTALQLSDAPGGRPLFLPTCQQQAVLVNARDVLVACEVSIFHLDAEPVQIASGCVTAVCSVQIMQDWLACACTAVVDVSKSQPQALDFVMLCHLCLSYLRRHGSAHILIVVEARA